MGLLIPPQRHVDQRMIRGIEAVSVGRTRNPIRVGLRLISPDIRAMVTLPFGPLEFTIGLPILFRTYQLSRPRGVSAACIDSGNRLCVDFQQFDWPFSDADAVLTQEDEQFIAVNKRDGAGSRSEGSLLSTFGKSGGRDDGSSDGVETVERPA